MRNTKQSFCGHLYLDKFNPFINPSSILNRVEISQLYKVCEFSYKTRFKLLYRASVDGFGGGAFYSKCNRMANTLTIIKTTKSFIFGGFARAAWKNYAGYIHDSDAFLFSLVNKQNIPMKFKCTKPKRAIFGSDKGDGPMFSDDLVISCDSNEYNFSLSCLSVYKNFEFEYDPNTILAGEEDFFPSEIEVFQQICNNEN